MPNLRKTLFGLVPSTAVNFVTAFAFLLVSCSTTPPKPLAPYSEAHLDFAKWNRTPECCFARGSEGAVASGGTHSSKAGIDMLAAGGNVVDAAVATAFALGVERPHSAGLGGGGFLTLHLSKPIASPASTLGPGVVSTQAPSKQTDFFVDFRETAPRKARRDMYLDAGGKVHHELSQDSVFSVATPGFVAGLFDLHQKWGKLPWKQVLEPAAKLAAEGFTVYPSLERHLAERKSGFERNPYTKKIFFKGKLPLKTGDLLVQTDLARSIRLIGEQGKGVFYRGEIARKIATVVKQYGGILDRSDLERYEVKFREPVRGTWKGFQIVSAPPPSAGGVMLVEVLNVLSGFELRKESADPAGYTHLLAEVLKRAYADRSRYIGDPDFVQMPYQQLMTMEYAERLRTQIDRAAATPSAKIFPGDPSPETHGTTHLSIIDKDGNAVASTLTINGSFGSGVFVPGTGIVLNNEMDDFSSKPGDKNLYGLTGGDANAIAPNKRPVSSMTPTIILKGGMPILAVGGAGGSRIITGTTQVILNFLDVFPGDLKRSVFAPRMHHQWLPDRLDIEPGFPAEARGKLEAMGHTVASPLWTPQIEAVALDEDDKFTAVFDPRDEGGAAAR